MGPDFVSFTSPKKFTDKTLPTRATQSENTSEFIVACMYYVRASLSGRRMKLKTPRLLQFPSRVGDQSMLDVNCIIRYAFIYTDEGEGGFVGQYKNLITRFDMSSKGGESKNRQWAYL